MDDRKNDEKYSSKHATVKKSAYNKMLGGFVVALVAASFAFGFILGDAGEGSMTGQVAAPSGGSAGAGSDPGSAGSTGPSAPAAQRLQLKANDPGMGDPDAPVRIFEWSDFQCPFCRRSYTDYIRSQLKTDYIDTGKVYFVYKDFPLNFHEGAEPYALAAECANKQGMWEEAHNKIFDEQNRLGQGTIPYPGDEALKQWMQDIGINMADFNECLDSGEYMSEIDEDFNEGVAAGVSGTPTFYIGNEEKGYQQIVGAQPYTVIRQAIENALAA